MEPDPRTTCRVYCGSHGCEHDRGHDGPHECVCLLDPIDSPDSHAVVAPCFGADADEDTQLRIGLWND